MKKSLHILLSAALLFAFAFSGCDFGSRNDPYTLYVGNYYGALGDGWLKEAAAEWTKKQDNGFKIEIINEKDLYNSSTLLTTMKTNDVDVYLLTGLTYETFIERGLIADITGIVTEPLEEYGESENIEDKMFGKVRDYYNYNDKYYALPFHMAFTTIVYDIDLFDDEDYLFYFNESGTGFISSAGQKKSAGPDKIAGNGDDGLPVTMAQFKQLMDYMIIKGVTPFTWTGQYPLYRTRWLSSVWADYEDAANFNINNSFSGVYDFGGGPVTINDSNAYLLQGQRGKLYALELASKIMSDTRYYTSSSFLSSQSHLSAQDEFLMSRYKTKPIGMIIENVKRNLRHFCHTFKEKLRRKKNWHSLSTNLLTGMWRRLRLRRNLSVSMRKWKRKNGGLSESKRVGIFLWKCY